MYSKIMIPVDLNHVNELGKALDTAATLAKTFNIPIVYVGVTTEQPSSQAHTPAEYAGKLEAFAREQGERHGIAASAHAIASHDPAVDLDPTLIRAIDETGADLVVMASHIPSLADYLWPSNGGKIAAHAACSVMVVRDH